MVNISKECRQSAMFASSLDGIFGKAMGIRNGGVDAAGGLCCAVCDGGLSVLVARDLAPDAAGMLRRFCVGYGLLAASCVV